MKYLGVFVYEPPEDETVDGEYVLYLADGTKTDIAIQDCGSYAGGYAVNRYSGDGDKFTVTLLGSAKTLKKAKEIAVKAAGA